jgi:hypothetical protein
MIFSRSSLADYFFNSRQALKIAKKNAKIYALISEYNMTTENIDAGMAMLDGLMEADKKKIEARGKQLEFRVNLEMIFSEVHPLYMSHVKLAKIKCQGNVERVGRLMLLEPRKTRINDWLRQADTFYSNLVADTEMMTRLNGSAITQEKLTTAHGRIKEVEQAHNDYIEAKGISQSLQEGRDILLDEFKIWMNEFITVCKIALRQYPQLLEILGITILSKGYVRTKSDDLPVEKPIKLMTKITEVKTKPVVTTKDNVTETTEPAVESILVPVTENALPSGTQVAEQ